MPATPERIAATHPCAAHLCAERAETDQEFCHEHGGLVVEFVAWLDGSRPTLLRSGEITVVPSEECSFDVTRLAWWDLWLRDLERRAEAG